MAHSYRLLVFLLLVFLTPTAYAQSVWTGTGAAPAGYIDLAGWIKDANGVSSRAFADGNGTRATPTNSTVNSTSTALVQTSKGLQSFDIQKTASVDLNRIGGVVAKFAKRVGPVGMTVTAVSLVCELTSICKDISDNWVVGESSIEVSAANCTAISGSGLYTVAFAGNYYNYKRSKHPNCGGNLSAPAGWGVVAYCGDGNSVFGCPWGDNLIRTSQPVGTTPSQPHAPTQADWDSKQPLLNDPRFVPELNEKGEDIPTGVPTVTPGQKKQLGLDSVPTKDSSGNITGREDTSTEIEAVDAGTADKPGSVIIKEIKTTIKYDTNNTQISSTTNTSYSSQPEANKQQQSYEIKFDEVPPANMQTYNVPNTFSSTSWGSGTCPPDIDVVTNNVNFSIPTQPVCDTAIMVHPFILMLSALIGIYIIAGVRGGNQG